MSIQKCSCIQLTYSYVNQNYNQSKGHELQLDTASQNEQWQPIGSFAAKVSLGANTKVSVLDNNHDSVVRIFMV